MGPGAENVAAIEEAAVAATGEFPVIFMASTTILGEAAVATWDKLDISIFSSVVSSCLLGFLKQESRSTPYQSLSKFTLRVSISLGERMGSLLSAIRLDG